MGRTGWSLAVATLVDFVAIVLPWLPIVLLAAWPLRRFARRLRQRKATVT